MSRRQPHPGLEADIVPLALYRLEVGYPGFNPI
ncbi:MAG: hypothetical protein BWX84_03100 [Verrucomicrobia bacterium ADurb.Bin118]|nr:MAG: hypothetical protein BWX84_03100 [Verrucomicrobia bacterium ADurb.Bin118]